MTLFKNFCRAGLYAALGAALLWPAVSGGRAWAADAQQTLHDVWEHYMEKGRRQPGGSERQPESADIGSKPGGPAPQAANSAAPGRHLGRSPELAAFAGNSDWRFRAVTYELYFDSSEPLARAVFGLARLHGDIRQAMPLARFEKGAQGFHYGIEQVARWASGLLADSGLAQTREELRLLQMLIDDGVIIQRGGKAVATGRIRHILGAAPGKKRDFLVNLRHERLHIFWDEDQAFADSRRQAWNKLSAQDKEAVYGKLKGYSRANEPQIIEEWAIYQAEDLPEKERRKLSGI